MSFNLKDHLPKGVADALFEDDAPTPQVHASSLVNPPPVPPQSNTPWPQQPAMPTPLEHLAQLGAQGAYTSPSATLAFLTDLRSKTDFDATPIGQQLKSSMDALDGTGLTDDIKSKTAMKLSHQSPAQVVSVLQGLQSILVSDRRNFDATMQTATAAEVDARQAKSAQLQSSIDDAESRLYAMRQEKAQVVAELQQKQDKITSARANYAAASEARNTELTEMITHYQSIPEVK